MTRLRLELLGDVVLGAAAPATMRIAALVESLFELVAAVLSKIRHEILLEWA
jgi:hypothetical protein